MADGHGTDAGGALAQIEERGYAEKYRHFGLPIHQVGVTFSEQTRNIWAFEVRDAPTPLAATALADVQCGESVICTAV